MIFAYSLIVILLMLVINAIFASYEMALASVSRIKLRSLTQENKYGAQDALFMKDKIEGSLAVIQIGITLVGAIAAAVGGAGSNEAISPYLDEHFNTGQILADILALTLFIIPLTIITIIFGELVPKTFALKRREWVCLKLSPAMRSLYIVFSPIVSFLEKTVKSITAKGAEKIGTEEGYDLFNIHELKTAASMARASRLIGICEEKIVHSAAELSTRPVKNIIIPASEISVIPLKLSLAEALVRAHFDMHTRFPVCDEDNNPQSIIGYVNFKDIIYTLHANPNNPDLRAIVRPMKSFDANAKISSVMEEMIRDSLHIALVKDGQGVILGMVTLEDILEELVGEILDEYDRLPTYIHPYSNGWVMAGGVSLDKVAQVTGIEISHLKSQDQPMLNTLAQWCRYVRKGNVKGAESFEHNGLVVTVRKFRRKQVLEAFVEAPGVIHKSDGDIIEFKFNV
ncbi:MAG: hemolysin family protein [bacterium]